MDDIDAIKREHGGSFGTYVNPVNMYNAPIHDSSDSEVAKREHGAGIGVPVDGIITHGTNDDELKTIVDNLIKSNAVNGLNNLLYKLPDGAIIKIIERRFRNSAFVLKDKYGLYPDVLEELSKNIVLDLKIIQSAIEQKRNIFDKTINTSIFLGEENYQNIVGLLNEYQTYIEAAGTNIPMMDGDTNMPIINPDTNMPYEAIELIDIIRENAKSVLDEMGINSIGTL